VDRGYIKLWRKLQDNKAIYHDPHCLSLLIHLLFMAEWRSGRKVWFDGRQVELLPGQLTAGRKQLAVSVGLSERNIRTCLDKLTTMQITTIKPTNKYSLITILNWHTYQSLNNENDQQNANDRPTTDQRPTTIKELKNTRTNNLFDLFWSKYPRKVGKENARRAFEKLKVDDSLLNTLLSAVESQGGSEQWLRDGGKYIPHPATWLNGKRWEDEVLTTKVDPYANLPNQKF